jgi:hypothetical protein
MAPVSNPPAKNIQPPTYYPLELDLPDPLDESISDHDFLQHVETAWQVCDRFDLETEIWRGRILRAVRDREKRGGEGRGAGFLNWLQNHELSKTSAYRLIELANSADTLIEDAQLDSETINRFSKAAFVETAQSDPEVQQLITDAAREGKRISRREVKQTSDEWTAMASDLVPAEIKTKAAHNTIPSRYLAPLVRELEKLPPEHQSVLQEELITNPDLDTLKQITAEAKSLAKYLSAAAHVQALDNTGINLEQALEESLRLGCMNSVADFVNQAAQVEQTIAKLYTGWTRLGKLADRLYVDTGESTPQLRSLLQALSRLTGSTLELEWGANEDAIHSTLIRLQIEAESDDCSSD